MTAKATRHYKIVRPGDVYPTAFNPGDTLPDWAVAAAVADGAATSGGVDAAGFSAVEANVGTVIAEPGSGEVAGEASGQASGQAGGQLVGKTTKKCEIEIDGKPQKFKAGVTVYGDTAKRLISQGAAIEIRAGEAPETK